MRTLSVRLLLASGLIALLGCAGQPTLSTNSGPEAARSADPPRPVEALVTALNANDMPTLTAFVRNHYRPGEDQAEEVRYWARVYREVGPLVFVGREDDVLWHRGTITRAWLGIRLTLDSQGRFIEDRGVRRGVRPRFASPPAPNHPDDLSDKLGHFFHEATEAGHFSGAVIVAHRGRAVFEGAFGYADREAGQRNSLETPFRLASTSKMFTGVALAQLVQAGLLSFDDPLSKFVPEYPEHIGRQVTVHHLLTHTSGIELDDNASFNDAIGRAGSIDDLLQAQLRFIERLNRGNYDSFEPLGTFDYTNEGIDLLGVIIERASGQSWAEYLNRKIFTPAGMTHTTADLLSQVAGLATPYTLRRGAQPGVRRRLAPRESAGAWRIRPAGSATSTASDMLRFVNALHDQTLLSSALVDRLTSAHIVLPAPPGVTAQRAYGYTFDIMTSQDGTRSYGHRGGAPGMSAAVHVYPDLDYTVIVLSNFDSTQWWVSMHIQELIGAT